MAKKRNKKRGRRNRRRGNTTVADHTADITAADRNAAVSNSDDLFSGGDEAEVLETEVQEDTVHPVFHKRTSTEVNLEMICVLVDINQDGSFVIQEAFNTNSDFGNPEFQVSAGDTNYEGHSKAFVPPPSHNFMVVKIKENGRQTVNVINYERRPVHLKMRLCRYLLTFETEVKGKANEDIFPAIWTTSAAWEDKQDRLPSCPAELLVVPKIEESQLWRDDDLSTEVYPLSPYDFSPRPLSFLASLTNDERFETSASPVFHFDFMEALRGTTVFPLVYANNFVTLESNMLNSFLRMFMAVVLDPENTKEPEYPDPDPEEYLSDAEARLSETRRVVKGDIVDECLDGFQRRIQAGRLFSRSQMPSGTLTGF